jgi:hypothetical protein
MSLNLSQSIGTCSPGINFRCPHLTSILLQVDAMSQDISFTVTANWGQWYATLVVTNIKSAKVDKYLGITFKSPVNVGLADFNLSLTPQWVEHTLAIGTHKVDASTFLVAAKVEFPKPYTFNGNETLTFGLNGHKPGLPSDSTPYKESFKLLADPVGTVNIHCAVAPDKELVGRHHALTFSAGTLVFPTTVTPGDALKFPIFPFNYTVIADELTTQYETVVATAVVKPTTINVENGKLIDLNVTYSQPKKFSAIDVIIGNILPIRNEQLHVKLVKSGQTVRELWTPNHTNSLRRLPDSGTIAVSVDTTLNNKQYSCNSQSVHLSTSLFQVKFPKADKVAPIDTHGFVTLPIVVETDLTFTGKITVRLVSLSPANLIYTQEVATKAGTTNVAVPVSPMQYTVQARNFIQDYTVYVVKASPTLIVTPDGKTKLTVKITRGANLKVPGFPKFLSFGGISQLALKDPKTFVNEPDFVTARASSVFKYAGEGGNGNPERYLEHDTATVAAIHFASDVGQKLGQPVLPVMISYTCNLSGTGGVTNLTNPKPKELAHTFGNLILSLKEAENTIKGTKVTAMGFVINPDFIGACQQNKLTGDAVVNFVDDLKDALKHWKIDAKIPADIENTKTLRSYVHAVNWLVRTVSSKFTFPVTFGWQVNLWGVGSAFWIYGKDAKDEPAAIAKITADYAKEIGVFDHPNCPDFLAIDRYEGDDFTSRGYIKGYCFGPREWPRFFDFCEALSEILLVPVMPWQFPSSHTPLVSDLVTDLEKQHWGTGGSYILGDAGINSHYSNINQKILSLKFSIPQMGEGVQEMFTRKEAFDWTNPAYVDFPLRGIFAILLGGGDTTGIASDIGNAGPWVLNKLHAYMDHPIPLDNLKIDK